MNATHYGHTQIRLEAKNVGRSVLGKTMKQDQKANSKARVAEAISALAEVVQRNASTEDSVPTILEIKVIGKSEEILELEIENLNELLQLLTLNGE